MLVPYRLTAARPIQGARRRCRGSGDDQGADMGTTEHLAAGDPYVEATAMELWAAGELHDDADSRGAGSVFVAATGLLVALATFFVAFAPGA
jgi:hypothetical protein